MLPPCQIRIILLALASAALAPGAGQGPQVSFQSGETTIVNVQMHTEFSFETERLKNPARFVVNCRGAGVDGASQRLNVVPVHDARVNQVRFAGFAADTIRVVIDLNSQTDDPRFVVQRSPDRQSLTIEISGAAAAAPVPEAVPKQPELPPPPAPPRLEASSGDSPRDQTRKVTIEAPATTPPPQRKVTLPPRLGILTEVPIALSDALLMALANNPDIQSLRIDGEQAAYRVNGARGVYDALFNSSTSYLKQVLPVASTLAGSNTASVESHSWQTSPSLSGAVPLFGGHYEVSFFSQRYSTNNNFNILNPTYPTSLSLQFTQPLWRNLHYDQNRHSIEVAKKNREMTAEVFRCKVMEMIQKTEQAYWELVFARRELAVQVEALEIALNQEDANRRLVDKGLMAPIDVVSAQTQVSGFEINLYAAQNNLTKAENAVKELILGDRSATLWTAGLNPTTPLETADTMPAVEEAISEAIKFRAESAEIHLNAEINQAQQRLDREQLKPQVDLNARYTFSGLAGRDVTAKTANPLGDSLTPALIRLNQLSAIAGFAPITLAPTVPAPAALVGGYGTSLNRLFGADFPTYLLELRVSLPVRNRAAQADLDVAMAEAKRIEHRKHALELRIEAEVRDSLQAVDSARQRLESARSRQRTTEEQYQSEERRFHEGASTLFLVEQRRLTMVISQSQVHRAEADLSQAISAYQLAHGDNYKRWNITIQ